MGCTSALVVVLPAPWVPLSHTMTNPDATFNGLSTQEHQDPHARSWLNWALTSG